ncbi:unnamed protein product [Linum trigynum]|uniref:Transcription repressor n=1 Tax=Linum trigynum TaxID=586398 RepID=A0AAV2CIS6_9ROSI
MGKRLNNLKLSFSFCRSKRGDAVAPATAYRLSPFNPKACDINFPKFPSPPPTTPDDLGFANSNHRRRRPPLSKMAPNYSRSSPFHDLSASDCSSDSMEFSARNDAKWQARTNYANKISLQSCDFGPGGGGGDPNPGSQNPKLKKGGKKSGAVVAPCDEKEEEEEEEDGVDETESFCYSSRSFSFDDTSCEFSSRAGETTGSENEEGKLLRRGAGGTAAANPSAGPAQRMKEMRRQALAGGGKLGPAAMGEAMAVVKKSTNPKEDFKRSMMEMIAEKEIYDAKELEELLQCLLSLNSRQYHGDIVEAFSEIWKVLFISD